MRRIALVSIVVAVIIFTSINIQSINTEELTMISVEVRGEVEKEKIIKIPLGSHFEDILSYIELNKDADISMFSLNDVVYNNQIIVIPKTKENNLISINTADVEELCNLPGIGEKMANRIIEYRQSNGSFRELDDLKNIKGIGDKKYDKIKQYITL